MQALLPLGVPQVNSMCRGCGAGIGYKESLACRHLENVNSLCVSCVLQLVFVPPDFPKYTAVAERVRAVFRQLDPDFESGGLDEAHLDVTDYCRSTGRSGEEVSGLGAGARGWRSRAEVATNVGVLPQPWPGAGSDRGFEAGG